MLRYAAQPDSSSCVPVALLNIYKWLGLKVTIKADLPRFKHMCKWFPGFGVHGFFIHEVIQSLKEVQATHLGYRPSLQNIDSILEDNGIVLLRVLQKTNSSSGHVFLVVGKTKDSYITVNDHGRAPAVNYISRHHLVTSLQTGTYRSLKGVGWFYESYGYAIQKLK